MTEPRWNYRIIKSTQPDGPPVFGIHEVFYGEDDKIKAFSEKPMPLYGESEEELGSDLDMMATAFEQPVLDWDQLQKEVVEVYDPTGGEE